MNGSIRLVNASLGVLVAGLLLASAGCGGDLAVEVDSPLLVVETYPKSGATVPPEGVRHLRVTFSMGLGEGAAASTSVREHFLVDLSQDGQTWQPVQAHAWSYEPEGPTMVITLGEDLIDGLQPGRELRLTITSGLVAAGGATLPTDVVVFVRIQ